MVTSLLLSLGVVNETSQNICIFIIKRGTILNILNIIHGKNSVFYERRKIANKYRTVDGKVKISNTMMRSSLRASGKKSTD